MDYQMNTIEQILYNQKDRILSHNIPMYEATEVVYESIDKRILELVAATEYNCKYVIIVGAILINSDSDVGSFNSTKRFEIINLKTGVKENLISHINATV